MNNAKRFLTMTLSALTFTRSLRGQPPIVYLAFLLFLGFGS
jgi:hypothetical protein